MNADERNNVIMIAMHSICLDVLLWNHASHVTHGMISLCKLWLPLNMNSCQSASAMVFPFACRQTQWRLAICHTTFRATLAERPQPVATRTAHHQWIAIHVVTCLIFLFFCWIFMFYPISTWQRLLFSYVCIRFGIMCSTFVAWRRDIFRNGICNDCLGFRAL